MHEPVLVLNANFEPINVCTTRRAIGLLLAGKADMVVNGRGHIRTVKQLLPRPSVIRLENQVHRPRPHVKLTRREVFRRDNYTCQYCGKRDGDLTVDHVIATPYGWTAHLDQCRGGLSSLQPPQRRAQSGGGTYATAPPSQGTTGKCHVYIWQAFARLSGMGTVYQRLVTYA